MTVFLFVIGHHIPPGTNESRGSSTSVEGRDSGWSSRCRRIHSNPTEYPVRRGLPGSVPKNHSACTNFAYHPFRPWARDARWKDVRVHDDVTGSRGKEALHREGPASYPLPATRSRAVVTSSRRSHGSVYTAGTPNSSARRTSASLRSSRRRTRTRVTGVS